MIASLETFVHEPRVAYFSMEIALRSDIPTYSGGLGVLAGDTMRSSADLDLPMIGVTLASRAGYFRQEIEDGRQVERPDLWQPEESAARRLSAKIALPIGDHEVWVGAWLYIVEGNRGGAVPVILLDTDLTENAAEDRELTHYLYGGDDTYRLKQEIVLGIGGVRLLRALGFSIRKYHLNEGHASLLTLELLRSLAHTPQEAGGDGLHYDVPAVRQRCVFTTHTPIEAGHDQFSYELADRLLGGFIDGGELRRLAGQDRLNMTRLALNLCEHVNGVARKHAEVSRRMFPGYRVDAVTNGVHSWTWACDSFRRLYDKHVPRWCHEPELLIRADRIPDEEFRQAHAQAKGALLDLIRSSGDSEFDAALPLLGFARRMTPYKRADLLFSDLGRLKAIARRHPFQIVLAGKAHPRDRGGRELIERLHNWARELQGEVPVLFIPDYDMDMARLLVSGVDVWLNMPMRPLEASGTSGMKAALNGVPNLSVPDGWWLEGWIEGVTGWAVGGEDDSDNSRDALSLYDKLEHRVLPLYHGDPAGWIAVMKGAVTHNASYFNSHRMMRQYAVEAYLH
jgi:starch phosphorylase